MAATEYHTDLVRTGREREAVFAIRMLVFVEEQAVPPDEELDAFDVTATHFLVRQSGFTADDAEGIVGTARLVDKGSGVGKVGRVALLREHRGRGAGALLMRAVEEAARTQGFIRLILDAQLYAIPFYAKLGYVAEGEIFPDSGIEHRQMVKKL